MGSKGDCYDDAVCESFHASLEKDLLRRRSFPTRQQARTAVFDYIEAFYTASGCTRRPATARPRSTSRTTRGVTASGRKRRFSLKRNERLPNVYVSTEAGEAQIAAAAWCCPRLLARSFLRKALR